MGQTLESRYPKDFVLACYHAERRRYEASRDEATTRAMCRTCGRVFRRTEVNWGVKHVVLQHHRIL
jgi:hypothetical protein